MNLEELGFTKEELQDRVVDNISEQLLRGKGFGENGEEFENSTYFKNEIDKKVRAAIEACICKLGDQYVIPKITEFIESVCLQETNSWGEKKGKSFTFIEYLTERANAYILEKVNSDGQSKTDGSYNWNGNQTRITYLVGAHLQDNIAKAMKEALKTANSQIVKGIEETVKIKLKEVSEAITLSVK